MLQQLAGMFTRCNQPAWCRAYHDVLGLQEAPHDVQDRGLTYGAAHHLARITLNREGRVAGHQKVAARGGDEGCNEAHHVVVHVACELKQLELCVPQRDRAQLPNDSALKGAEALEHTQQSPVACTPGYFTSSVLKYCFPLQSTVLIKYKASAAHYRPPAASWFGFFITQHRAHTSNTTGGCARQGTSQVMLLRTVFPCKVQSLSTRPEISSSTAVAGVGDLSLQHAYSRGSSR
jgi:hypothetical protein